jgi:hypothetical protein
MLTSASAAHAVTFGYSDDSHQDGLRVAQTARVAKASGAKVQRVSVHWGAVQCCDPARWDWRRHDRLIAAIQDSGLRPLPVLVGTPYWARPFLCSSPRCPPTAQNRPAFAEFVRRAVARWHAPKQGRRLAGVQIWNEPNNSSYWPTAAGPSGNEYAALFNHSVAAVDAEAGGLPVITGGLDGRSAEDGGGYRSITTFLRDFYDTVDRNRLDRRDAVGVHPYAPRFHEILGETRAVLRARDPGRALWATETGSSTGWPGVTPALQARHIAQVLRKLRRMKRVRTALVYTLVEKPGVSAAEAGLGVTRRVGEKLVPKPAYCRIATVNRVTTPRSCR